jgi:hypothetical protein
MELKFNSILILFFHKIQANDGLPDKICKECTEKAYLSYNFKATIEQSDATLRSLLFKEQNDVKSDTTNYLMGIKTEIAFVDADPFIDDEGDFDESLDYAESSNTSIQQNDTYNNNSHSQDGENEDEAGDSEDDGSDENSEMNPPKKKLQQLISPNVDYVKDDEGKYVCQICNKKLVDKKGLNLHIRLHTGENLKRCHVCNRGEKR